MPSQIVEQIGVKNDHDAAFCDEELRFGTVMEEVMKSKTGYRAKYYRSQLYRSQLCGPGGIRCFFSIAWP